MGSNVNNAQSLLLQAQSRLEAAKNAKKRAIANGNYARCKGETPTFVDGKKLNRYDYEIYRYQQIVKRRKEQLAKAKKAAKK